MNVTKTAPLRGRLMLAVVLAACYTGRCMAQQQLTARPAGPEGSLPSFETATVRVTARGSVTDGQWSKPGGSTFRATSVSLEVLLSLAYGIDSKQIKGAPAWLGSRYFDINAKAEDGIVLTREALRPRLQRLLQERFHMRAHNQMMPTQGFALVVGQRGPKLVSSTADQRPNFRVDVSPGKLRGTNWSMDFCALMLTPKVGRPVINRTGLQGSYDVDVEYAPNMSEDSSLPSLFTAIQDKLGLRLVSQEVPVDVLIVDEVNELPTEN